MARSESAFQVLQAYLQAKADFSIEEFDFVRTAFFPRALRPGELLQRGGEVAKFAAFVARGCLRSYVIDPKGKEHIVQFAPENWWLGDNTSLASGVPSQYFIDAIEDSEVLLIDPPSHEKLVERIPGYAAGFRKGLQRHAAAKDRRIVNALSATAEQRYMDFLETYRSIATRVPQWMLASYLGLSPETISRIRRKLSRKSSL
jgi:CRP-like cAMP-binding protein